MPSEVQKIGPKFQVTIPKAVRNQLGLKVGDLVQARVGKNHTIVLERKRLVDFEQSLDEDLRASKADYAAGRYLGPFDTAEEMIKALRTPGDRRTVPIAKRKKPVAGRVAKSAARARTRFT
jgi:AbrB family looped-hinge helix DNA binding protein